MRLRTIKGVVDSGLRQMNRSKSKNSVTGSSDRLKPS